MQEDTCLNLCEILHLFYQNGELENSLEHIGRIYFGSYFCGLYFGHISRAMIQRLRDIAIHRKLNITMVIPIFTQRNLQMGKEKIAEFSDILGDCLDEITVNDYGMLAYVDKEYSLKINLGRLITKDYRDPRYEEYFSMKWKPKIFTEYLLKLLNEYRITGLEFDQTHAKIDFSKKPSGVTIGIHTPYCYMTVGQICEYSSIPKEIDQKFRPNIDCQCECMSNVIHYDLEDNREWIRLGRTIYFLNTECKYEGITAIRNIHFPFDLEVLA